MHYFIALSAVNVDSCKAFLKTLAILYQSYGTKYTTAQKKYLLIQHTQAADFARQFKLTKLLKTAVTYVADGKDPVKDDDTDDAITDLLETLKPLKAKFDKETDISRAELSLLNDFRLAHFGSESAAKRIDKNVSSLGDPLITILYVPSIVEASNMKAIYARFDKLVAKHGGSAEGTVPLAKQKEWVAKGKATGKRVADHATFLELRKEINQAQKDAIRQTVRSSAEELVDVRDVAQELKRLGIRSTIPNGFVGKMDDAGRYYTSEGRQLLNALSGEVHMNPRYDAKKDNAYVCKFTPPFGGAPARAYTVDYRAGSKSEKFDLVAETLPKLDRLTKKWLTAMRKVDKSREGLCAVLCEFIYETSARVGNKTAETAGERTFGATQLQARHFKRTTTGFIVTYLGKSAGKQRHVLKFNTVRGRQLGDALEKLLEGKSKTDPVFTFEGKVISGTLLNRYLKSLGFPDGFTIHKLRTARGTVLAQSILAKSPFKKGGDWKDIEVHRWLEKELLKVGAELGHMTGDKVTANTAIQNYISPEILATFYAKLGIRPSAKMQKAIDSAGKTGK